MCTLWLKPPRSIAWNNRSVSTKLFYFDCFQPINSINYIFGVYNRLYISNKGRPIAFPFYLRKQPIMVVSFFYANKILLVKSRISLKIGDQAKNIHP